MIRKNLILLLIALCLGVLPLILPIPAGLKTPFAGADDQSMTAIALLQPDYQPWFKPLWTPPSTEVASLLFAVQAALGAGLLGYYFGLRRGQSQQRPRDRDDVGD